ncbi:MAG: hypothetical protein H6716_17105 [Polyangiaceae bacterium]|nr:hypothetical protein [Polyangiaceae bacterium]
MLATRPHPLVYDDIDEVLAHTRERFGPRLRHHPTIGALHSELGEGVRVFCIRQGSIRAPHGYIYKVQGDGTVYIARFVRLATYLAELLPEDF